MIIGLFARKIKKTFEQSYQFYSQSLYWRDGLNKEWIVLDDGNVKVLVDNFLLFRVKYNNQNIDFNMFEQIYLWNTIRDKMIKIRKIQKVNKKK